VRVFGAEAVVRKFPVGFGVVLEGEISALAGKPHLIDFRLGGRRVCLERSAHSSRLRDGDRIRVLLQQPCEGAHSHVTAFQGAADATIRYTGPQLDFSLAMLGGLLLAAGLYTGIGYLLIPAVSLLLLKLLLAFDRDAQLATFRAA
jgi:hypothetical protein